MDFKSNKLFFVNLIKIYFSHQNFIDFSHNNGIAGRHPTIATRRRATKRGSAAGRDKGKS